MLKPIPGEDPELHENNDVETLGERIRNLRKQRRLTQSQLGRGVVTASMISQIESDRVIPSAELLQAIATRLNVQTDYFAECIVARADAVKTWRHAKASMERGDFEQALELIQSVVEPLRTVFKEEVIQQELVRCYEALGNTTEAIRVSERLVFLSLDKGDVATAVHTYYRLANMFRRRNEHALARLYLQRAAILLTHHSDVDIPVSTKVYASLARICFGLHQYEEAIHYFALAAESAQKYESLLDLATVRHGLANVYLESGDVEQARHWTDVALDLYQRIRNVRGVQQCQVNLGVLLNREERYEEAQEYFTSLTEKRDFASDKGRLANCLAELAVAYNGQGMIEEAISQMSRALQLDAQTAQLHLQAALLIGEGLLRLGRTEDAFHELSQAVQRITELDYDISLLNDILRVTVLYQRASLESGHQAESLAAAQDIAHQLLEQNRPEETSLHG